MKMRENKRIILSQNATRMQNEWSYIFERHCNNSSWGAAARSYEPVSFERTEAKARANLIKYNSVWLKFNSGNF